MDTIKEKLDEKDYNKFMEGEFDKNKVYKGLIEEVSEYGYDEEEPDGEALEASSRFDEYSNYWFYKIKISFTYKITNFNYYIIYLLYSTI